MSRDFLPFRALFGIPGALFKQRVWIAVAIAVPLALWGGAALAEYCWSYVLNTAENPQTWTCSASPASGASASDLGAQTGLDEHANWHCTNGDLGARIHTDPDPDFGPHINEPGYGRKFLGFHKQVINDFNLFRDSLGTLLGRIETWDPNRYAENSTNANPMPWGVPGTGVSDADSGAIFGGYTCTDGAGRSGDGQDPDTYTFCPGCDLLYDRFRVSATSPSLAEFNTADDLGSDLDSGWHASFHGGISDAVDPKGNRCGDIGPPATSPRDSMFWRAHDSLDDVQEAWQRLQSSDIVVVLDRSGSMSDPPEIGSSITKLSAAKDATSMFAALIEDTGGHQVGVVSYASSASATPDLSLSPASSVDAATVNAALAPITANGLTAMGQGLIAGQNELTNGSNQRKAMLLLTDGHENVAPCVSASSSQCAGTTVAADAFGDTQICAVGYGDEGSGTLDEIVLRNLTERQGGIYTSGVGDLALKKFFVDCFAEIFNTPTITDPIDVLLAGSNESERIIVPVGIDSSLTFVLAWEQPEDPLRLLIRTPSGKEVDLNDAKLEQGSSGNWQFARIPLPFEGEGPGNWVVQAARIDPQEFDQPFFVSVHGTGEGRLEPEKENFAAYTDDAFVAKVRITAPYRPMDEFDRVEGTVTITRPLVGSGNTLAAQGLGEPVEFFGDKIDARSVKLREIGEDVPTEVDTFTLYDDGTNGDRFANNHYWTAEIPEFAKAEGSYRLHFVFQITEDGVTFQREVFQTVHVSVKIDPDATTSTVDELSPGADGRNRTRFVFTPMDALGNLVGPGRANAFELSVTGDAEIEGTVEDDGQGGYEVIVSWLDEEGEPSLVLAQNGRVRQTVLLPEGRIETGLPDIDTHFGDDSLGDGDDGRNLFPLVLFVVIAALVIIFIVVAVVVLRGRRSSA